MVSYAEFGWIQGASWPGRTSLMNTADLLSQWKERSPEQWLTGLNRYLPPGVTLLLVIGIAYQLSKLTWLVVPAGPTGELPVAGPLGGDRAVTQPSSSYDNLIESHLFGTAPKTPPPATEIVVDAPDTTLNLSLTGILFGEGNVPNQAIISSGRNAEKTYHIGQAIDNANGATLHAVYADRVILNRGDRLETLRLPKVQATSTTATRFPGAVAARPTPAPNGSSLRQVLTQNASRLTDIIRVAPQVEQGQVVGFRINPGRDREAFEALGLQAGDVVTDINGTTLNDASKGLQVFQQLGEATQANVTVLRDGAPQVLVVDTSQLQSLQNNDSSSEDRQ